MANNRIVKIEGEFRRGLSEIFLTELKDPRMSPMTSVTRVEITQDLKYAKVYVSIMDTPQKIEETVTELKSAEGFIRAKLNERIKIRRIPNITFIHDNSIEYSIQISKLIDEAREKDSKMTVNGESHEEYNR